jgi:hypothetical protein
VYDFKKPFALYKKAGEKVEKNYLKLVGKREGKEAIIDKDLKSI